MDTTAAAQQANVTTDTIRNWCRKGVVAAIKQAGRWVIDAASLAYRIGLPKMLSKQPKPLTAKDIVDLGGRAWTNPRTNTDRIYLNDWYEYAELDVEYYGTGNVAGATLGGKGIANSRVASIVGAVGKVYFDTADGLIHITGRNADAVEVRYLSGERNIVDLAARIRRNIRAAIAAL